MSVLAVEGALRRYAWGSTTAIPQLLGVPPDGQPAAELWFGAHPDDPSHVPAHARGLDALIAADPAGMLGAETVDAFGPRLPFLLKILAAGKPLSIQVHPDLDQARAGFAAEEQAGVPRDGADRNYRDPNHKPELLCAVTPFDALCGFRPVERTLALLAELALPELTFLADRLRGPDPLRAAFTALLTLDDPGPVVAAVTERAHEDGPLRPAWLAARDFPGDVGVVLTLLLNEVRLERGEAIYLGAGNVHAYLSGMGVEIMANSDNVLRCGLTPKHVDIPELLRITDFSELAEPRWSAVHGVFDVPVPDFRLTRMDGPAIELALPAGRPRIVLCTAGSAEVDGVALTPGAAAFAPVGDQLRISGSGTVFVAS